MRQGSRDLSRPMASRIAGQELTISILFWMNIASLPALSTDILDEANTCLQESHRVVALKRPFQSKDHIVIVM
jgi:hypothetical protein